MNSPIKVSGELRGRDVGAVRKPIPAFTYQRAWRRHKKAIMRTLVRVMDSGNLILGSEVNRFENEFSAYVGTNYGVGAASGTDALIVALRALNVGMNDEVITVANGPVPTVAAIRAVGAIPQFVDIDSDHLQMCPRELRRTITARTKCVIPIHLYGHAAPMAEILDISNSVKVPVIEDGAQGHGTRLFDQHVGTFGSIACFSFYPTKNLGAFGDAGICVTNNPDLASKLREISCYGFRGNERIAIRDGINSRLDEVQAALLRLGLNRLPSAVERRRKIAGRYLHEIKHPLIRLPDMDRKCNPSWHQFVLRVPYRTDFVDHLAQRGIGTGIHYQHPVHLMPAYRRFGYSRHSLPNTERACLEVVSLPMFPELRDDEVQYIIECCNEFYA